MVIVIEQVESQQMRIIATKGEQLIREVIIEFGFIMAIVIHSFMDVSFTVIAIKLTESPRPRNEELLIAAVVMTITKVYS